MIRVRREALVQEFLKQIAGGRTDEHEPGLRNRESRRRTILFRKIQVRERA